MYLKPPRGSRVGIVGVGGGASVLAADECEDAGLEVPVLPDRIRRELLEYTPSMGVGLRNPLDLDTDGFMNAELAARTVRTMSEWEGVDFLILAVLPGILLAHAHVKVLGRPCRGLGQRSPGTSRSPCWLFCAPAESPSPRRQRRVCRPSSRRRASRCFARWTQRRDQSSG